MIYLPPSEHPQSSKSLVGLGGQRLGHRCGFRNHWVQKDHSRAGPKLDWALRTPGMNDKKANVNQGQRSAEDQLIQSKAVFPL